MVCNLSSGGASASLSGANNRSGRGSLGRLADVGLGEEMDRPRERGTRGGKNIITISLLNLYCIPLVLLIYCCYNVYYLCSVLSSFPSSAFSSAVSLNVFPSPAGPRSEERLEWSGAPVAVKLLRPFIVSLLCDAVEVLLCTQSSVLHCSVLHTVLTKLHCSHRNVSYYSTAHCIILQCNTLRSIIINSAVYLCSLSML